MKIGITGLKCGMSRIFTSNGDLIPVTVIYSPQNKISQIKSIDKEGYNAIQVAIGEKKSHKVTKAEAGHFLKAGIPAGIRTCEFLLDSMPEDHTWSLGHTLDLNMYKPLDKVDVVAISKGKGFAGCIKRHGFARQDATHGNSLSHRAPGSAGMCQTPGRVLKGKKMAGHMGDQQVTVQNLSVVAVYSNENLLLVKGCIPGPKGAFIIIKPAIKHKVKHEK